jgi:hypothetical protein
LSYPQPTFHFRPVCAMSNCTEDCNMSEYSTNWDLYYSIANQPLSPQTDPIRESPDRNDASGSTVPTDPGGIHETTSIAGPPQIGSFGFGLPDTVIHMHGAYSSGDEWHISPVLDLPSSSNQSFNPSIPPSVWYEPPYLREVRSPRYKNLDTC